MGIAQRRQREKENLRRAILDAARALFETEDYGSISIRKIAEKIEYSPAAIYLHFKDKKEILLSLIAEGFADLEARLRTVSASDPLERMRQSALVYLGFAQSQPQYYKLMFQVEDADLAQACAERPHGEAALGYLVDLVAEGAARGLVRSDRDPILLAHALWAAMHGAVCLGMAQRLDKLPPEMHEAFHQTLLDVVFEGVTVRK